MVDAPLPDIDTLEALPFRERVHLVVRAIPEGRVASYGDVAAWCGSPRAARGVGAVLNATLEGEELPWWRVVNRTGRVTIPAIHGLRTLQRTLLEREGIPFDGDVLPIDEHRWRPPNADPDG